MKYLPLYFVVLFLTASIAYGVGGLLTPSGGGLLTPGTVIREGTAIQPAVSGDTLGTFASPWSAGYFSTLHASSTDFSVLSFTIAGGDVNFGWFDINNVATGTMLALHATSTNIAGLFDGKVGIGTTTPAFLLHVANVPLGNGTAATTTVEFGSATTTSRTCFNVRDAAGVATSFYFVGTGINVEANPCR